MTARGEHDEPTEGDTTDYVSFGYFEPFLGKRIMACLARERVRFTVRDATRFDVISAGTIDHVSWRDFYPRTGRNNRIELLIHRDDETVARKLIEEM
jgi:hypothetical protein